MVYTNKEINKLTSLLTLCSSKGRSSSRYLLIEPKGGSLGRIKISLDNDYYYNVVNIIITFHFENRFLQDLQTMVTNQKAIFLIAVGLLFTIRETDGKR